MPTYVRLTDYKSSEEKERGFFKPENRYEAKQEDFEKIPGSTIAYWVTKKNIELYNKGKVSNFAEAKEGLKTGNNEKFLRYWFEVDSNTKWRSIVKGGEYRKWYGNFEYVINWINNGELVKTQSNSSVPNNKYLNRDFLTWSNLTSGSFSLRAVSKKSLFETKSPGLFCDLEDYNQLLGFYNSKIANYFLKITSQTLDYKIGPVLGLPYIKNIDRHKKHKIDELTQECINVSKEEWDSRETSWDFRINELIRVKNEELRVKSCKIEDAYNAYCDYWREKFFKLHANEEELNRLFIDIYELQDELTPDVPLEDITILKNEAKIIDGELVFQADEIMKQLISYGVGVMFGRYSLDHEGLHIADMGVSLEEANIKFGITYPTFEADDDNIIPVLEDDYFKDDIASRFVQFVKAAFGEEHLSENIKFIEDSLGTTLRKYFVKGFYEDHIKRYKKRPIYWMVASTKKGFMSLLYMHRYQSDLFARVRNSYLTEYIAKLEAHKETLHLTLTSETASNKDKKDADKKIKSIEAKLKEVIAFDREKMMSVSQNPVEIDLDDGVKVNYCKFKDILYPITGLCKK